MIITILAWSCKQVCGVRFGETAQQLSASKRSTGGRKSALQFLGRTQSPEARNRSHLIFFSFFIFNFDARLVLLLGICGWDRGNCTPVALHCIPIPPEGNCTNLSRHRPYLLRCRHANMRCDASMVTFSRVPPLRILSAFPLMTIRPCCWLMLLLLYSCPTIWYGC